VDVTDLRRRLSYEEEQMMPNVPTQAASDLRMPDEQLRVLREMMNQHKRTLLQQQNRQEDEDEEEEDDEDSHLAEADLQMNPDSDDP
jgi:hypothetical protein